MKTRINRRVLTRLVFSVLFLGTGCTLAKAHQAGKVSCCGQGCDCSSAKACTCGQEGSSGGEKGMLRRPLLLLQMTIPSSRGLSGPSLQGHVKSRYSKGRTVV